jgi:two-component system, OmpR family, response regulator
VSAGPQVAAAGAEQASMGVILVIDDEPEIRRLVRICLTVDGHQVIEAADGRAAIEVLRDRRLDLLLLDLMMPEVDGWAVLAAVAGMARGRRPRVVVLSALAEDLNAARARLCGADAYVQKPFDPFAMEELIDRLLAGGLPARSPGPRGD